VAGGLRGLRLGRTARSRSLARRCALKPTSTMAVRISLMVSGSVALRKNMAAALPGRKRLLAHLAQQVAHVHGDVAKVDLRPGKATAHLWHTVQWSATSSNSSQCWMLIRPAGLLFVQKGLDQQRGRQNLVARAVEQVGARHMRGAHRFALAAAQAVFDRSRRSAPMSLLLHDQRLVAHQTEAGV